MEFSRIFLLFLIGFNLIYISNAGSEESEEHPDYSSEEYAEMEARSSHSNHNHEEQQYYYDEENHHQNQHEPSHQHYEHQNNPIKDHHTGELHGKREKSQGHSKHNDEYEDDSSSSESDDDDYSSSNKDKDSSSSSSSKSKSKKQCKSKYPKKSRKDDEDYDEYDNDHSYTYNENYRDPNPERVYEDYKRAFSVPNAKLYQHAKPPSKNYKDPTNKKYARKFRAGKSESSSPDDNGDDKYDDKYYDDDDNYEYSPPPRKPCKKKNKKNKETSSDYYDEGPFAHPYPRVYEEEKPSYNNANYKNYDPYYEDPYQQDYQNYKDPGNYYNNDGYYGREYEKYPEPINSYAADYSPHHASKDPKNSKIRFVITDAYNNYICEETFAYGKSISTEKSCSNSKQLSYLKIRIEDLDSGVEITSFEPYQNYYEASDYNKNPSPPYNKDNNYNPPNQNYSSPPNNYNSPNYNSPNYNPPNYNSPNYNQNYNDNKRPYNTYNNPPQHKNVKRFAPILT